MDGRLASRRQRLSHSMRRRRVCRQFLDSQPGQQWRGFFVRKGQDPGTSDAFSVEIGGPHRAAGGAHRCDYQSPKNPRKRFFFLRR